MTEQVYEEDLTSFASDVIPAAVETVPVLTEGAAALEKVNRVRCLRSCCYGKCTLKG